jgi:endonuclease YncB( thermonuclease family)
VPSRLHPTVIPTVSTLFFLATAATAEPFALDGDTIVIGKEHIRIANIDTPEIRHAQCDAERRLGLVAKHRMEALLAEGQIEVQRGDPQDGRLKDRYGRTLATISVGGRDIGEILIEEELARPWAGRRQSWCD